MQWNKHYFRNHGPEILQRLSVDYSSAAEDYNYLIAEARAHLQPPYKEHHACAVLMGSPGPSDMEFVTLPCNRKTEVAGIMCIKRNKVVLDQKRRLVYKLIHYTTKNNELRSITNGTSHFNIDYMHGVLSSHEAYTPMVSTANADTKDYFENLDRDEYSIRYNHFMESYRSAWNESLYGCGHRCEGFNCSILCDALGVSLVNLTSHRIQQLTQNVILFANSGHSLPKQTLYVDNGTMAALQQCSRDSVLLNDYCIRAVVYEQATNHSMITSCDNVIDHTKGDSDVLIQRWQLRMEQVVFNHISQSSVFDKERHVQLRNQTESRYMFCATRPHVVRCPASYMTCGDGCISEVFFCDGIVHCEGSEDERKCDHLCQAAFATSLLFCLYDCHPNNCTCHELYFHCPKGGCLHSAKLCDGHADCAGAEDETICSNGYGTMHPKDWHEIRGLKRLNDFFPDTLDGNDEETYKLLLTSHTANISNLCNPEKEIPCLRGHTACYPVHAMCVYDHTPDGHMKYCRNGLHLDDCHDFACSGTFKCWHSYCIPAHKVCDGRHNCPYGEDEALCPINTCKNMLRCGNVCVHPNEICDGFTQCDDGDDEIMCDAPLCPETCVCHGYATFCRDGKLRQNLGDTKMLSIKSDHKYILRETFANMGLLLFLDLSWCGIDTLESGSFTPLMALYKLDLSHNTVDYLDKDTFAGLSCLQHLDLSWNPMRDIDARTFDGLTNLNILILKHSRLTAIPSISSSMSHSISVLDISHGGNVGFLDCSEQVLNVQMLILMNTTVGQRATSTNCFTDTVTVLSDQIGLCCLKVVSGKCITTTHKNKCHSLLVYNSWHIYNRIMVVIIALSNGCVIVYQLVVRDRQDVDNIFVSNLALANVLVGVPLYLLSKWHSKYAAEFPFFEAYISAQIWCSLSGCLFVLSTQMSTLLVLLTSLVKYCGIARRHTVAANHLYIRLAIVGIWLMWYVIIFTLKFEVSSFATISKITDCLFGPSDSAFSLLLIVCGIANMLIYVVIVVLYSAIFKKVLASQARFKIGRKHGTNTIASTKLKLICITVISTVPIILPSLLVAWLYVKAEEQSAQTTAEYVTLVFPLQSVLTPLLFTLCTSKTRRTSLKQIVFTVLHKVGFRKRSRHLRV